MKACIKCNTYLPDEKYRLLKSGNRSNVCKKCKYERDSKYRTAEEERIRSLKYYHRNKEKIAIKRSTPEYKLKQKELVHNCYLIHKEKGLRKSWESKFRNRLFDGYVKYTIVKGTNLSSKDIPQDVVKLKRKQLLIKRKLKSHGKES